jgi:hypothetical protein
MTSSISSVSTASAATTQSTTTKKSNLSQATKFKLEALGIQETDGMTEAQAQAQINQAQQQQGTQDNQSGSQNSSESEILSEAKSLAALVGVSVSDDADVSEILADISTEIEGMLEGAENNPAILSTVSSYISQLTALDDQYENLQAARDNVFNSMEMVSTSNKISLGLN